ncbi:MAG: 6-carboxytetrahydropterin synthase [Gammaproteobacteria bacterium]|nr:6-carboxytetrahydropterin synthase [Gammaproteobacteria bacterium]
MKRFATIELHKEELKFSAGHLMTLSSSVRESLHGHDYQIGVVFQTRVGENGLAFDLREYREHLQKLCHELDYHFILPGRSAYLHLEENNEHYIVHFANETFSFLKKDTVVLPIVNVTLEELSWWILQQLTKQPAALKERGIVAMTVKVFNGRNESGACHWEETTLFSNEETA